MLSGGVVLTGALRGWLLAVDQQVALGAGGRVHGHLEETEPRSPPQLEALLPPLSVPLGRRQGPRSHGPLSRRGLCTRVPLHPPVPSRPYTIRNKHSIFNTTPYPPRCFSIAPAQSPFPLPLRRPLSLCPLPPSPVLSIPVPIPILIPLSAASQHSCCLSLPPAGP